MPRSPARQEFTAARLHRRKSMSAVLRHHLPGRRHCFPGHARLAVHDGVLFTSARPAPLFLRRLLHERGRRARWLSVRHSQREQQQPEPNALQDQQVGHRLPSGAAGGAIQSGGGLRWQLLWADGNGIFGLSTSGTYTVLFSPGTGGITPNGFGKQAADGNFYGRCSVAGVSGPAHVCRVTTSGAVTPIFQFPSGRWPANGILTQGSDGFLYGAAWKNNYTSELIFSSARRAATGRLITAQQQLHSEDRVQHGNSGIGWQSVDHQSARG